MPVEGGYAPRYAATDVRLSAGGDKAFARVTERGKAMSWRWSATLPEPVLEGATATYPDVVPGGDLVVTATSTGFTHNVVLRERPTKPVAFTIPVAAQGAELAQDPSGGLQVATPAGKTLVETPAPVTWDASENEFGYDVEQPPRWPRGWAGPPRVRRR